MSKAPKAAPKELEATILEVKRARLTMYVVGETPLIVHAMSAKAKEELLFPGRKKNNAEKLTTLKHDPIEEYRACFDRASRDDAKTAILAKATWFKGAMMTAALDQPGVFKSTIGRLCWVYGDYSSDMIHLYGIPQLHMSVVRQAGMNKTPDIRSRPILSRWCCEVTVGYSVPLIAERDVVNLLAAGGITSGVGDWRVQKGSGSFGSYRVAAADDEEVLQIMATGGREAQLAAIEAPTSYNEETDDLIEYFNRTSETRGLRKVS